MLEAAVKISSCCKCIDIWTHSPDCSHACIFCFLTHGPHGKRLMQQCQKMHTNPGTLGLESQSRTTELLFIARHEHGGWGLEACKSLTPDFSKMNSLICQKSSLAEPQGKAPSGPTLVSITWSGGWRFLDICIVLLQVLAYIVHLHLASTLASSRLQPFALSEAPSQLRLAGGGQLQQQLPLHQPAALLLTQQTAMARKSSLPGRRSSSSQSGNKVPAGMPRRPTL